MRTSTFIAFTLFLIGLLLALIYRSSPPAVIPAATAPVGVLPAAAGTNTTNVAKELFFCSDFWPPYADQAGTAREGYVVELLRVIYEPLGYRVHYTVQPWSRCLAGVRSGRFVGLAGTEHGDVPDLIFPRQMVGGSLPTFYVDRKSSWTYRGEASLRQLRLGVAQNYTYAPALDRYIETERGSERITVFRGDEPLKQMFAALQAGRIDVFVENSVVVAAFLDQRQLPGEMLRQAGIAGSAKGVFVPFSPIDERSPALAALFDRRLAELRRDGGLQHILQRYRVSDWSDQVIGRGY